MSPWWSLVGVVLRGFVAAGRAFLLEELRRRHQRRDKRDDIKREAPIPVAVVFGKLSATQRKCQQVSYSS